MSGGLQPPKPPSLFGCAKGARQQAGCAWHSRARSPWGGFATLHNWANLKRSARAERFALAHICLANASQLHSIAQHFPIKLAREASYICWKIAGKLLSICWHFPAKCCAFHCQFPANCSQFACNFTANCRQFPANCCAIHLQFPAICRGNCSQFPSLRSVNCSQFPGGSAPIPPRLTGRRGLIRARRLALFLF